MLKDIISAVISGLALVVSGTTAYLTLFRGPKLKCILGEVALIRFLPNGKLKCMPEVAMYNEGSGVAVIHKVDCSLKSLSESRQTEMDWISNLTTEYLPEKETSIHTRFESFPATTFVSKSEAYVKRLEFQSQHAFPMPRGDYQIALRILAKARMGDSDLVRVIRVRDEDVAFLAHHFPKRNNEPVKNLRFNFNHALGCYLSTLSPDWRPKADNTNPANPA